MRTEPTNPYVYQPDPPNEEGDFYGVGGLEKYMPQAGTIKHLTRSDAEKIVESLKSMTVEQGRYLLDQLHMECYVFSDCGCRFESHFSNAVIFCEQCSKRFKGPT